MSLLAVGQASCLPFFKQRKQGCLPYGSSSAPDVARRQWLRTAAANWLATAVWAGRFAPEGAALLIDAGSTTTDIVPLWNGRPMPLGLTDPDRLRTGELVYTGARRTPVCALL